MKEPKLLTERQIARRKTAAIWLIGMWMALICTSDWYSHAFSTWAWNKGQNDIWTDAQFDLYYKIFLCSTAFIKTLLFVCGLLTVKRLADASARKWIKHWAIASIVGGIVVCRPIGIWVFSMFVGRVTDEVEVEAFFSGMMWWEFNRVIWPMVTAAFLAFIGLYKLWAVTAIEVGKEEVEVRKSIRLLQVVLVISMLDILAGPFCAQKSYQMMLSEWHETSRWWEVFQNTWSSVVALVSIVCSFFLFLGVKKLFRSRLFASTPADITAFAQQPQPKMPLFPAPVCGAVAAVAACAGISWLIIAYWGQWGDIFW